jgi:transposase
MTNSVKFIGLDVHKETISIAIADNGRTGEVRYYGTIKNRPGSITRFIKKMNCKKHQLHFVYEAGPCGYVIYRHLKNKNIDCMVTAPSTIPKKSSDRIKNDRRDALALARLHRAGELTPVYVPDQEDEAIRDLSRAREDAREAAKKAKQRLGAFLLRHGYVYPGKTRWSKAHMNWIVNIGMAHRAQQLALDEYIDALTEALDRVDRLTDQIRNFVPAWRMGPVVAALQSLRGVSLIVAVTTVAELGDLSRFDHPSQLMAYLGLVPSEHSSGEHVKRKGITKTGNGHVRRVLVEAAWAYRLPARRSRPLLKRQQGLAKPICQISWKAQLRLCTRYRQMMARGKNKSVVITAIARELAGFIWDIARQVPAPA